MGKVRVVGPRIEVTEAKAMVDSGDALILDVVASHVWPSMTRTIQGSVRIPPEEVGNRFDELPRDKMIIAYCTWSDEFTSARVASFLEKQGYRAFALKGGYMAWYKAGYPIDRKEATAALPVEALCPDCGEPIQTHTTDETPWSSTRPKRPVWDDARQDEELYQFDIALWANRWFGVPATQNNNHRGWHQHRG